MMIVMLSCCDTLLSYTNVGSTHEVVLSVDAVRSRNRLGDTECERLFGIIPAKFNKTTPSGHVKVSLHSTPCILYIMGWEVHAYSENITPNTCRHEPIPSIPREAS